MSNFILEDLDQLTKQCRIDYKNLPTKIDIPITPELKNLLIKKLGNGVEISEYSIEYTNDKNQYGIFPSKWFWVASVFYKLAQAYEPYSEILAHLKKIPEFNNEDFLKQYPFEHEPSSKTQEQLDFEKEALSFITSKDSLTAIQNFDLFKKFIYERSWWNQGEVSTKKDKSSGKNFWRTNKDLFKSTLLTATQFIVSTSDKLTTIIYAVAEEPLILNELQNIINNINAVNSVKASSGKPAENIIFYGAPGTGKSFAIEEKVKGHISIRTVFHPETQYSDFVGCLRPSMDDNGIEYSFKKGPFIEALLKAIKNPEHHYYLIIEEINRAPAAAVFGELFQLLDRDKNGESEYRIDINDKDLLNLLNKEHPGGFPDNKLYIPNNLSLYATMNSSDQAVMPLDTAFKRRWKFEYMPLDFSTSPSGVFDIITEDGLQTVSWLVFAKTVNSILSLQSIPEDRHLGPWFVNENEIFDQKNAKKTLTGKVLMYIWDDVLRHSERSALFNTDIKTFGSLVKKIENNEIIFSENFLKVLEKEIEKTNAETQNENLKPEITEEEDTGEN
ncbi:McrB family protein [Acinetobacter baumannii]|uniref:McrB family protein n=1 Tax=Acinetobacter baumannii TaxID=470 RepID=UPI003B58B591